MVGVDYGNSKLRVTYNRSKNKSSCSCCNSCSVYSTAKFYSTSDYFQRQKTANVYVKTVQFIYSVKET